MNFDAPIEVEAGLEILRMQAESTRRRGSFTVWGACGSTEQNGAGLWPELPVTAHEAVQRQGEMISFLAKVGSRSGRLHVLDEFGVGSIQAAAAIFGPTASSSVCESFDAGVQADFDFRQTLRHRDLSRLSGPRLSDFYVHDDRAAGYSEIDPAHGEDEFIISDFTAAASTVMPSAADTPVSRLTSASARRVI